MSMEEFFCSYTQKGLILDHFLSLKNMDESFNIGKFALNSLLKIVRNSFTLEILSYME